MHRAVEGAGRVFSPLPLKGEQRAVFFYPVTGQLSLPLSVRFPFRNQLFKLSALSSSGEFEIVGIEGTRESNSCESECKNGNHGTTALFVIARRGLVVDRTAFHFIDGCSIRNNSEKGQSVKNNWGRPTLTLLKVLNVLNVLKVLNVPNVLNIPIGPIAQ